MTASSDRDGATDAYAMAFLIDPADCVVLFADLQPAIIANSGTNPPALIEAGAVALAEAAALFDAPALFSVVPESAAPATHLAGLERFALASFTRRCASPFGDPLFVEALQATGRRTLIISGYSTEAVILFSALDALARCLKVIVALDASGGRSTRTEAAVLRRIETAGAIVTSVADVLMSSAPDFASPQGKGAFDIVHRFMASACVRT